MELYVRFGKSGGKMIGVLPEFLIFKNRIINKKTGKAYILPDELIRFLFMLPNATMIHKDFVHFLETEHIIGEISREYLPFVKETEMNKERLFIQLTDKCNLYCKHCFISAEWGNSQEYDFEKLKCLIEEAIGMGIYRIDFTGGEISTLPWLTDLIDFLDYKPIEYCFFTNLVIDDKKVLHALKFANGLKEVITSLDYFEDEKHDTFRGKKGAFRATMDSISSLYDSGINISVNTMVLGDNYNEIISMIDYFYPLGIYMCFDMVVKKGRAKKCHAFLNDYKMYVDIVLRCKNYIKDKYNSEIDFWGLNKCGVGESLLYVDKNARFQLCPGLTENDKEEFYLGDTISGAIAERGKFDLKCEEICKFHDKCSYGCRERAFLYSGNLKSKESALCYLLEKGL